MKKFAMITHFTGLNSAENSVYYPLLSKILKILPKELVRKWIPFLPPHQILSVSNIKSDTGSVTSGCAIMCPLLPEQFIRFSEEIVLKKLIRSCSKAKSFGADIVGLAAFTSVVGNEGQYIADNTEINVTSGNTFTACLAIDSILKATDILCIRKNEAKLVVLGATGDIGSICTKALAESFRNVTLVARNSERLNALISKLPEPEFIGIEKNPEKAVASGDVVLSVTSSVLPLFDARVLKPGSIFCDVSIPATVSKKSENFRPDVLIYDGGKAKLPNAVTIKGEKWKKLFPNDIIFGCLAETILLALEEKIENFSIGRGNITLDKVSELREMSIRHGFATAPFSFGNYIYSPKDLEIIRKSRSSSTK